MQQKQEDSLNEIQLKLAEMNQVKDILMATNELIFVESRRHVIIWFNQIKRILFSIVFIEE